MIDFWCNITKYQIKSLYVCLYKKMYILMFIRFINLYVSYCVTWIKNCVHTWYCFIFLDDNTRVILKDNNGEDYINASYISVSLILGYTVGKKNQVLIRIFFMNNVNMLILTMGRQTFYHLWVFICKTRPIIQCHTLLMQLLWYFFHGLNL